MDPLADACSDSSQWSEDGNDPLTELAAMLEVLRRRCAVDFSGYKTSTLSRRIRQRMARSEVNSAQAYCSASPTMSRSAARCAATCWST